MTEIKYKDTTIPVEAGQTVTLNTTGKKLTGDIAITAPKESGGGAKKYSITYVFEAAPETIIAQPTEIYEGQTVYFVYAHNPRLMVRNTNCTAPLAEEFYKYRNGSDGWVCRQEISNPTGDVTVTFYHTGGSN